MSRPELGKVAVGDRFLVRERRYDRMGDTILVEAVKVGRVWVDLREVNQVRSMARTWRMRMDTQREASDTSYSDRFVTQAQLDWEERELAAENYLREAGIQVEWKSDWRKDRVTLANLIRRHLGEPEI